MREQFSAMYQSHQNSGVYGHTMNVSSG